METFELFARPWWVNLTVLVPFICFFAWKQRLSINKFTLFWLVILGVSFGFIEAIAVVYLRVISGSTVQTQVISSLPQRITNAEMIREFWTLILLLSLSFTAAKSWKERFAVFFFTFAVWDIVYYIGLKLIDNWPNSLFTQDVVFLLPIPWYSQIWFPVLVNSLLIIAVLLRNKEKGQGG